MQKNKDILDDLRLKENPYDIPESYFENLKGNICAKCSGLGEEKSFFRLVAPYVAMAASFVLIALAGSAVIRNSKSDYLNEGLQIAQGVEIGSSLSEDDIINYLIAEDISSIELSYLQNYE